MSLLIILLVVAAGAIAYLLLKPKPVPPTATGGNTGFQPLPSPAIGPYGTANLGYPSGLGYKYPAGQGGNRDLQAGLGFASSTIGTIGNVLGKYFDSRGYEN